jgi:hypothetical protein
MFWIRVSGNNPRSGIPHPLIGGLKSKIGHGEVPEEYANFSLEKPNK